MDFYLKFPDAETANSILYTDALIPNYLNIDTIGTIYKPTGTMLQVTDPDGVVMQVPEMAAVDGYHVNVRLMPGEDGTALEPFATTPSTPQRVWA